MLDPMHTATRHTITYSLALVLAVVLPAGTSVVLHYRGQLRGGLGLMDKGSESLVRGAQAFLGALVEGIGSDGLLGPGYTCGGFDKALQVRLSGIPGEAKALALMVYDPDAPAGTFIHWLVVKPVAGREEVLPAMGVVEGLNDSGEVWYRSLCLPPGNRFHGYFFPALAIHGDSSFREGYTLGEPPRGYEEARDSLGPHHRRVLGVTTGIRSGSLW